MCERGRRASHNEGHDGQNIRPRQLPNREVRWEGSSGSKLRSRRTERPYQVDGAGEHARQGAARCSAPEINGPAVQQEFTSLLRETCSPVLPATAGAVTSNGHGAGQESAAAIVLRATSRQRRNRTGSQLRKGRTWRADTTMGGLVSEAMKPTGRAFDSDPRGRERVLRHSARTARNRRMRTRMYGGVGAGGSNAPGDPIRQCVH